MGLSKRIINLPKRTLSSRYWFAVDKPGDRSEGRLKISDLISYIEDNVEISSDVEFELDAATSDLDKFVVYNSSDDALYYRTGTEMLSDLNLTGTTDTLSKFSATGLTDSIIQESGTSIGINTTPSYTLHASAVDPALYLVDTGTSAEVLLGTSLAGGAYLDMYDSAGNSDIALYTFQDSYFNGGGLLVGYSSNPGSYEFAVGGTSYFDDYVEINTTDTASSPTNVLVLGSDGKTIEKYAISSISDDFYLDNEEWLKGRSYNNEVLNIFKISKDNVLDFGIPVRIGALYHSPDSGLVNVMNMPVTYRSGYGEEMGFVFSVTGDPVMKLYGTADGAGGLYSMYAEFKDEHFLLVDSTDTTKKAQFNLELITTETEREYKTPDRDGELALRKEKVIGSASTTWNFEHGLGRKPNVSCTNNTGTQIFGRVEHTDNDNIVVYFGDPQAGLIECS